MKPFDIHKPIPESPATWDEPIAVVTQEEPLICISETLADVMIFEPRYYMQGIHGATPRVYVRKSVCNMLLEVARALPAGYKLKIYDAWRPAAVQKGLFWDYYRTLAEQNPQWDHEQVLSAARCFVSYPSEDPIQPYVHATGGAVDLTIVDSEGRELDMGTGFDDFTEDAYTVAFETAGDPKVRDNRRLLYNLMIAAGFTNYAYEWWHFDFGDRFWAEITGQSPIYHGIYTEPTP